MGEGDEPEEGDGETKSGGTGRVSDQLTEEPEESSGGTGSGGGEGTSRSVPTGRQKMEGPSPTSAMAAVEQGKQDQGGSGTVQGKSE